MAERVQWGGEHGEESCHVAFTVLQDDAVQIQAEVHGKIWTLIPQSYMTAIQSALLL